MAGKEIRKIQKPKGNNKEGWIQLPNELNFQIGDAFIFEKIDEKTAKLIKVA